MADIDCQITEAINEMLSEYEFAAKDCGDRLVLKLAASEAADLVARILDAVSGRIVDG